MVNIYVTMPDGMKYKVEEGEFHEASYIPYGITEEEYNDKEFKKLVALGTLTPLWLRIPTGVLLFDMFSDLVTFEDMNGNVRQVHKDHIKIDYEVIGD